MNRGRVRRCKSDTLSSAPESRERESSQTRYTRKTTRRKTESERERGTGKTGSNRPQVDDGGHEYATGGGERERERVLFASHTYYTPLV